MVGAGRIPNAIAPNLDGRRAFSDRVRAGCAGTRYGVDGNGMERFPVPCTLASRTAPCYEPAMPSFDVVSRIDLQEVDNALNQTRKEVAQRYDLKDSKTEIAWDQKEITVTSGTISR